MKTFSRRTCFTLSALAVLTAGVALGWAAWAASPIPEDFRGTWFPYSAAVQDHPGIFTLRRRTLRMLDQSCRVTAVERRSPTHILLDLESVSSDIRRMEIQLEPPLSSISRRAAHVLFYETGDQSWAGIEGWYQQ